MVVEQNDDIMKAFVAFYSTLYTTRAHYTIVELDDYLSAISLPKLTELQASTLDAPLTTAEIGEAIQSFARYKTPGLDGFPIEWYMQFRDLLILHLLRMYNFALKTGHLPPSMSEALIVLIPSLIRIISYANLISKSHLSTLTLKFWPRYSPKD